MSNYTRVIPRDLFNESNLLKCLGKVALFEMDSNLIQIGESYAESGFEIVQDPNDGSIYCRNVSFYAHDDRLSFYVPLNSREPWPMMLATDDDEIDVHNVDGSLSFAFMEFLKG